MVTAAALIALLSEGERLCEPDDLLRMRTEVRELFSAHSARSAQSMRLSHLAARCGSCAFVVHLQVMFVHCLRHLLFRFAKLIRAL